MRRSIVRRRGFKVLLLALVPAAIFAALYWREVHAVVRMLLLALGIGVAPPSPHVRPELAPVVLAFEAALFLLVFFDGLLLVSQFVLPVQTRAERWLAFRRLCRYVFRMHGPAVFIRNGRRVESRAEQQRLRTGPGVVLTDAVSVLVLQRDPPPRPPAAERPRRPWRIGLRREEERLWGRGGLWGLLAAYLLLARMLRVIITRWLHRIRWAFRRSRPGRAWRAWRDGRPRRPPRPRPQATRVAGPGLVFTDANEFVFDALDMRPQIRLRPNVKALTRDGIEVRSRVWVVFRLDEGDVPPGPDDRHLPDSQRPPFRVLRRNAFQAAFGGPVGRDDPERERVSNWGDLPPLVASEIFRDMLSQQTLDDLFRPTADDDVLPLEELRNRFRDRVRAESLLRERGIRVVAAGFRSLGVPDEVRAQRIRSWQAEWQRQAVETLAGGDLQTVRILQRARVNAQHDLVRQMNEILQTPGSKAAVALRLFQALDSACADPSIRRLLPIETLLVLTDWMNHLDRWLTPDGPGNVPPAPTRPGFLPPTT